MINTPTLRQLEYLLSLSKTKNFGKAAAECNIAQSSLSGTIKEMENILGADVLDRTQRKKVKLTPLGEEIVRDAVPILKTMESLTYRARKQNKPLAWPLRLGVIPTIAPYLLPRLLRPLQEALPSLDLHIYEIRSALMLERIESGTLDLGLMAFPYEIGPLNAEILFEEEFWCAAPPGHFFIKQKNLQLNDLKDEKLLLLEDGHCVRDHALEACKLQPLQEMKTFSAASLATLTQFVAQGYGITLLPDMAVKAHGMLLEKLTLKRFSKDAPTRQIGFVFKKNGLRSQDIKITTTEIRRILKKQE